MRVGVFTLKRRKENDKMLNFKEIAILSGEQTKNRKLCKVCGHSKLLGLQNKAICNYCGNYIFKNEEEEFKYRLKEKIIRRKRNEI